MHCLVTGGAGFIGSNLVEALVQSGEKVVVLDNFSTGARDNLDFVSTGDSLRIIEGDVRDIATVHECVAGADIVFHLAAEVGNLNSLEHPLRDSQVNILGTLNVLQAALEAGVKRLVYSSSSAIFGEPRYLPIDEDHPMNPESFYYAVSKLAAENYCLAFAQLYGMSVVCLRYFNVYGPRQKYNPYANVIPIFAKRLLSGQPPVIYGDGEQARDFVYVRDVVQANLLAAKSDISREVFNIGIGEQTTVNQLQAALQQIVGASFEPVHEPPRAGELRDSVAQIAKARELLGYCPKIDIQQGLAEFMATVRGYDTNQDEK